MFCLQTVWHLMITIEYSRLLQACTADSMLPSFIVRGYLSLHCSVPGLLQQMCQASRKYTAYQCAQW